MACGVCPRRPTLGGILASNNAGCCAFFQEQAFFSKAGLTPAAAIADDVPPLPFNIQEELSECTSIPPTDRSDTAWIVALLWFLSRENQRATSGYLRKPGNVKKVALIKQYVNKNFPRGLNELSWVSWLMFGHRYGLSLAHTGVPRVV